MSEFGHDENFPFFEFTENEASPEDVYQIRIHMKNGSVLWVLNQIQHLVGLVDDLMGDPHPMDTDSDGIVEVKGIKLLPDPCSVIIHVQSWNVAAVELVELNAEAVQKMIRFMENDNE